MKKERRLFIESDGFIYSSRTRRDTNDSRTVLFHSKLCDKWTEKCAGKPAVTLQEDGNGVSVDIVGALLFKLDYSQFVELRMAMDAHAWSKYKKCKVE